MSNSDTSGRLEVFVGEIERLVGRTTHEPTLIAEGSTLLRALVANDDWLAEPLTRPGADRYRQYLLHRDPLARFSLVSFVWGPGQYTPVHDHTVWGLIGVLRGAEYSQAYEATASGLRSIGVPQLLQAGEVEAVSPSLGDIHKVWNARDDGPSISIHLYGADIGAVSRHTYNERGERKTFISGYSVPTTTAQAVRQALIARDEIALIDLREEAPYALAHPLFAAQLAPARLELDVFDRIPRRDTPVVLYDDGEGLVDAAARTLRGLGYSSVTQLDGGLAAWRDAGYELFQDVNSASKAFGELVEARRHTPYITAEDALRAIENDPAIVVLDARRFDEYRTMSIPKGVSVPGAELVLRAPQIAADPSTTIIVNCAGRTRSIIGAQSLINAGLPNRVVALRNGTIGWTLAGQALEHGRDTRFPEVSPEIERESRARARAVADRAGVQRIDQAGLLRLRADAARTLYLFDVRTPEEFEAGHPAGFRSAPGGQLVQETDMFAPVRGARIVLYDGRGVRADMSASWLAQMGWDVYVANELSGPLETGANRPGRPAIPGAALITPSELGAALAGPDAPVVIDVGSSKAHARGHIPTAWLANRSRLASELAAIKPDQRVVFTAPDEDLAHLAARDAGPLLSSAPAVLAGGVEGWLAVGHALETGTPRPASPPDDIYRRPYEGTDNAVEAMQAYLDWEYGLVDQLERDGTHGFHVI